MAYINLGQITARTSKGYKRRTPNTAARSDLGVWYDPFNWFGGGQTDEQKAAENLANINKAVQEFKRAHEIAVALYRKGQLPDDLRRKHVELRDKINNTLVSIMNNVSPQEYLAIHNFFADVRKDVGLAILPLIIIGGVLVVASLVGTAALYKSAQNHTKELELVAAGKLTPAELISLREKDSGGGSNWIEKLTGINPMYLAVGALAIFFAPQIVSQLQKAFKKI